ncbi:MAG: 16S rRNA (uracil(1498)-N(3))-methyltransferase [Polyangiaceae bacterium]|nr:16S rRNA (uracil(1498)-N(3))-methyltransferase [Polyangiaceae bacterium]
MSRALRVPVDRLSEGESLLSEAASRYVVKVHRRVPGQELRLFSAESGEFADAVLVSDRLPRVCVKVSELQVYRRSLPDVHLIQSVGKGDKPEQAVRAATVFNATHLHFAISERSVARLAGKIRNERLAKVAVESARQCERFDLPRVFEPRPLGDILMDPDVPVGFLCAWAEDAQPLVEELVRRERGSPLSFLVGPEGGLSNDEVIAARSKGWQPSSLGPNVLRTETAAELVLGVASLIQNRVS